MSRTFLQMILIYFFEFLGDSCMTGVLSTSLFKTFLLHLEIRYLARYFLGFLSYCLNKGFFCKSQILVTLHFKYYNNNHYTFPYNQLAPDSTLYCLRRYYKCFWYIFEFLGDSFNWDFTYLFLQNSGPPFRNLISCFTFLGILIFILYINLVL